MVILQALPLWPSIFKLMLKAGKTVTLLVQMVSLSPPLPCAQAQQKPNLPGGACLGSRL